MPLPVLWTANVVSLSIAAKWTDNARLLVKGETAQSMPIVLVAKSVVLVTAKQGS